VRCSQCREKFCGGDNAGVQFDVVWKAVDSGSDGGNIAEKCDGVIGVEEVPHM